MDPNNSFLKKLWCTKDEYTCIQLLCRAGMGRDFVPVYPMPIYPQVPWYPLPWLFRHANSKKIYIQMKIVSSVSLSVCLSFEGSGRVVRRCCVSYITGASN